MRLPRVAATLAVLISLVTACASCGSTPAATPAPTQPAASPLGTPPPNRPASPAVIALTSPADGTTVQGPNVDVVVSLQNATVVAATSTNITPTTGHVHLYIDGNLQYMAYALSQSFRVPTGTVTMYAEFVASDHFPFNPRVYSKKIVFTVT